MARTATPRTLLATALSGALVVGLAACGGDDAEGSSAENPIDVGEVTLPGGVTIPDLEGVTIPDLTGISMPDVTGITMPDLSTITMPGGGTIPDITGITMPDLTGISIPDISIPDITGITMPGGMSLDDLMGDIPDFTGEGAAAFCSAVDRLDEMDELDGDTPAEIQAAIPQVRDIYDELSSSAPDELSPYVDTLVSSMAQAIALLEQNGYDEEAIDLEQLTTSEMMQASMAIGAYTDEFCES